MHPAQRGVTVGDAGHHNAQRADVIHLLKPERLAAHFLDNAVDVLGPSLHGGGNALGLEVHLQLCAQLLHIGFAPHTLLIQQACHLFVGVRLHKAERQVLQFPFDFPNAQAVG